MTGERSLSFWQAHDDVRRELSEAIIQDAGHDPQDAPVALARAADSAAQAYIIQASAYQRMVEAGGPLSASGRARRCFEVWTRATDRLERHLRMVGLKRTPRPAPSLDEALEQANNGGDG